MIHSLRLVVEKQIGDRLPLVAGERMWKEDDLPSRGLFFATLEAIYEGIELPFFPAYAGVEVELHDRIATLEADEPVALPKDVALGLWAAVTKAASGL